LKDFVSCPRISIVTPSFNQGKFLSATLESVLGQNYPALEYFVMDGGSEDHSVELIKQRESELTFWRSGPDRGQAAAINEGFSRSSGAIFGWVNSDDLYAPGAFSEVVTNLGKLIDKPVVIYGGCELFHHITGKLELRPAFPFDFELLQVTDYLDQPSVFWTRAAWDLVGPLDESLRYAFDWDWFLRAARSCKFIRSDKLLSRYRIHSEHKSSTGGAQRWKELVEVVRRHSPQWVMEHYRFLTDHPLAYWWLNKRMRLAEAFERIFPANLANILATGASPPFWRVPKGIDRKVLWLISGIRWRFDQAQNWSGSVSRITQS
jgi:glycosyltransferase involved in cell wall biosynthesis